MKKFSFLCLCLLGGLAATAQNNLVKDVERQMKSAPDKYPQNIATLKPAFTDAETAEGAYVWFVAGKGGMDYYDHAEGLRAIGKETDDKALGHALMDSYGYLINALKNDTIVDAKGKVKTKYSKDAVKLINGHFNDFNNAAIYLWGVQDYQGAYDAWDLYTKIPTDPVLGANAPKAPADSTLSDIYYNMALAAWQADRLQDALTAFDKAIAKGYDKKNVFDYAIGVAYSLQDNAKMAEYAAIAYPLYGAEDNRYIGYMINDKIANKQFDEAQAMLEKYIAADPNNSQLYYVLGILFDSQEKADEATANYKKALDLDPNNAQALLQYGRQLCNQAYRIDDEVSNLPGAEYNKARAERIDPLFKEAAGYLEKAYSIDPDNMSDALRLLRNVYYNLNDEENMKRVENL